jgi:hypothetical protein
LPWHSLSVFFENPWFRRIWCIQEIRLASDAVFYWGCEEFPEYIGVRLSGWYMNLERDEKPKLISVDENYSWNMIVPLVVDKCRLLGALNTYRSWQATDPRDKVYGILGLTELEEERNIITIDYEKSAGEVFHDSAAAIIRWTKDLAIFAHVHHDVDYDGHPEYESWVPQWDDWQNVPSMGMQFEDLIGSTAYGVYKFANSHESTTLPCGRQLVVSGSIHGSTSYTTVLLWSELSELDNVDLIDSAEAVLRYPVDIFLDYWRQTVSQEAPMGNNLSPAMVSMARTLTAGEVIDHWTPSRESKKTAAEHLQSFLEYIRLLYTLSENLAEDGSFRYDLSRPESGWQKFASLVRSFSSDRALFRAKDGSFGLGPMCLREGDLIVVLEGAYTPVALRPRGENYLLLGQVYKDEIMNGELIEEMEKGIRKRQQFCLV